MGTPAAGKLKVNRKVKRSAQDNGATNLTPAVASAEGDSECQHPILAHEEVARLAYSYWEARGCEGGSADEDWHRAEAELRARAG
jgi:hypothetical protein